MIVRGSRAAASAAVVAMILGLAACGGSGGDGEIKTGEEVAEIARASRISGMFASVETDGDPVPVAGVRLILSGGGESQEIVLDETRAFAFEAPASGDLNLRIVSTACTVDFPMPDVVDGSEIILNWLYADCTDGIAGLVEDFDDSFEGIVRSTTMTGPGLIPVCVSSGNEFITRFIQDPPSFAAPLVTVAVGDRIAIQGSRDWWVPWGPVDTELTLGSVQVLASGLSDPCAGQSTDSASPTEQRLRLAIDQAVLAIEEYGTTNGTYVDVTPEDITNSSPALFDGFQVDTLSATDTTFGVCVNAVTEPCTFCYDSAADFLSGGCA